MRKRALHVFLALGLVLSVFAGTLAVGSAQDNDNDLNNDYPNQSYLPWVPNGSTIDDPRDFGTTGPYYGTITVQNLESEPITVSWDALATGDSGSLELNALETTTVTTDVIFADNDVEGSGVVLTGDEGARIAAVQKQAAPVSPDGDARTGADHEIVAGYTGLTEGEIGADLVLPIVQTNNNWNTLIRLTNFSGSTADVEITLYEAGATEEAQTIDTFIGAGDTETIDLLAEEVPDDWTGSARISSDYDVAAVAERVKNETNMLIMNTSQPADVGDTQYAPLVFQEWFNWNTGISVANLAGNTNDVTITYYDVDGNVADQDTFSVPPNGMDFVYTPSTVLNDDNDTDEGFVGSAVISGSHPFRAAVDEVKYFGDLPDVNHAMSYMVEDDAIGLNESLALPLVQKGDMETAFGDTTGIQLFNPSDESAAVAIWFLDQDGEEALAIPQVVWLGPQEGHTAYTFHYDELPVDFQGSAIIRVVSGDGQVTAVSNNVNYEVQFDGSASFNLVRSGEVGPEPPDELPFPPPVSFTVEPAEATNEVGTTHDITVEVEDEGGLPVQNATVAGVVLSGPHVGTVMNETTGADGQATLSYDGTDVGTDQILIHVQGIAETQQVTKTWTEAVVEPELGLALAPEDAVNPFYDDAALAAAYAAIIVDLPIEHVATEAEWESWLLANTDLTLAGIEAALDAEGDIPAGDTPIIIAALAEAGLNVHVLTAAFAENGTAVDIAGLVEGDFDVVITDDADADITDDVGLVVDVDAATGVATITYGALGVGADTIAVTATVNGEEFPAETTKTWVPVDEFDNNGE